MRVHVAKAIMGLHFVCGPIIAFATIVYLRNEFNFWKGHGIMNTSGLVQSK